MALEFACPNCGKTPEETRIFYIEKIWCRRNVLRVDGDELVIDSLYRTDNGYDESPTDQAFVCTSCGHEWPVPPGLRISWT